MATNSTYQLQLSHESGDREKLHPDQTLFRRSQKRAHGGSYEIVYWNPIFVKAEGAKSEK
jgi:hypothetical protein